MCGAHALGMHRAFSQHAQGRIQDFSEGGAPYEKWGGGKSTSGPTYEKWGGGGWGGGQFASGTIPKVGGGGEGFASGPIRKVERGDGGGADTFVWHKENTLSLIIKRLQF